MLKHRYKMESKPSVKLQKLKTQEVIDLLSENNLSEFKEFVLEKHLDGQKFMEISEGIVKLWNPTVKAKALMNFKDDLKKRPEKYLRLDKELNTNDILDTHELVTNNSEFNEVIKIKSEVKVERTTAVIECQYQTVKRRGDKNPAIANNNVEDLIKRIVPHKSFLYRDNQSTKVEKTTTSYLPMNVGPKKTKKKFRFSYDYPDLSRFRFSKVENFNDRGYYLINTDKESEKSNFKERLKYKSVSNVEEIDIEEHLYEDLCYNDIEKKFEHKRSNSVTNMKNPRQCIIKFQEIFSSFKRPFFKKMEDMKEESKEHNKKDSEGPIYENNESSCSFYDTVTLRASEKENNNKARPRTQVEDYLEPIQASKDYCDVCYKDKHQSFLSYILSIFESHFGSKREPNDENYSENSTDKNIPSPPSDRKSGKTSMADRPLPVPVDKEPYYMNIDRSQAEELLMGQPDGSFILRPSSQPNHVYTLSVSCSNSVHNVGVRKRADGRIAIGYARKGERSFTTISALISHHRRRRLLLVASGGILGSVALTEPPVYYLTPSSIPVLCDMEEVSLEKM